MKNKYLDFSATNQKGNQYYTRLTRNPETEQPSFDFIASTPAEIEIEQVLSVPEGFNYLLEVLEVISKEKHDKRKTPNCFIYRLKVKLLKKESLI